MPSQQSGNAWKFCPARPSTLKEDCLNSIHQPAAGLDTIGRAVSLLCPLHHDIPVNQIKIKQNWKLSYHLQIAGPEINANLTYLILWRRIFQAHHLENFSFVRRVFKALKTLLGEDWLHIWTCNIQQKFYE